MTQENLLDQARYNTLLDLQTQTKGLFNNCRPYEFIKTLDEMFLAYMNQPFENYDLERIDDILYHYHSLKDFINNLPPDRDWETFHLAF